jgi:hypothetical protein
MLTEQEAKRDTYVLKRNQNKRNKKNLQERKIGHSLVFFFSSCFSLLFLCSYLLFLFLACYTQIERKRVVAVLFLFERREGQQQEESENWVLFLLLCSCTVRIHTQKRTKKERLTVESYCCFFFLLGFLFYKFFGLVFFFFSLISSCGWK